VLRYKNEERALPEISIFINNTIITDEDNWKIYFKEVAKHPSLKDLEKAKVFVEKAVCDK